jgi:1A family penicillin-binding protein
MANGRITRSNRRHAAARRRLARYGNSRRGQHHRKLPPNLIGTRGGTKGKGGLITIPRVAIALGALGLFFAGVFLVFTVITSVIGVTGTMAAYRNVKEEVPLSRAGEITVDTFQTTRIYDRDGDLLQEVDNPDYGWRTFVPLDQVAPDLVDATVASEDSTFWTNPGVDPVGIVRAVVINVSGAGSSGASTITQQLVGALYPDKINRFDISYSRKVREAMAAVALNQEYSKTDILTMYVNQIYYGNRSYGIEAAAQTYFNKHASELTLGEASMLAGLPQAPSAYDPSVADNFPLAKQRQRYVLDQMVKYHYITKAEANDAYNEPLDIVNGRTGAVQNAPHFTEYVRNYIIEHYGVDALYGGLEITTSIDLDLQQQAEQIVAAGVRDMEQYQRNNGAMVVMVPWSGEVLAMVGSADFNNALIAGQVNYATSLIQPGSSIKPIVYSAAFEKGWNPATVILDVPTVWDSPGQPEPYEPQNYSRSFYGAVTARMALANSLNIPAVKATEFAGVTGVMDVASRMGLKDSLTEDSSFYGLSLGLGSGEVELLEHTNAFATLANNGTYVPAHPILKITDSQGNVLYDLNQETVKKDSEQAIDPGNAYQVTSILTDTEARSTGFGDNNLFTDTAQQLGRPTAAKSGTTENWRDLWTMGYTTDVAVGVWVGRSGDTNPSASLPELDGIQAAGPIWQDMMNLLHDDPAYSQLLLGPTGQPMAAEFPVPSDVYKGEVCAVTGNAPTSGKTRTDWLVRGEEPQNPCGELTEYQQKQLDNARDQLRKGEVRWMKGAQSSVREYEAMATGRTWSGDTDSSSSRSSGSSGSNTSGSNSSPGQGDANDNNEPVPIEPMDDSGSGTSGGVASTTGDTGGIAADTEATREDEQVIEPAG